MAKDEELGQAGEETAPVPPGKQQAKPAWKKPLFIGLAAVAVIGIALGVGLSDDDGSTGNELGAFSDENGNPHPGGGEVEDQLTGKQNASAGGDDPTPQPAGAADPDPTDPPADDPDDPDPTPPAAEYLQETPAEYGMFTSSPSDALPTSLRTIADPAAFSGYGPGPAGCAALYEDIVNATTMVANEQIKTNAEYYDRYKDYWAPVGGGGVMEDGDMAVADSAPPPGASASESNSKQPIDESSFETNDQEANVREADLIKSDGTSVFAGYGDLLVVWDAVSGEEKSRTKMPPRPKEETGGCGYGGGPYPVDVVEGGDVGGRSRKLNGNKIGNNENLKKEKKEDKRRNDGKAGQNQRRDSMPWMPWNPNPRIEGLLLHSDTNRLVVMVSGYRPTYCYDDPTQPIMRDRGEVRVLVYDISPGSIPADGTSLSLLGTKEMWGSYRTARSIGSRAHIVVQSGIDMYRHFTRYLDRWNAEYAYMNKTEYVERATAVSERIIPLFADKLAGELKEVASGGGGSSGAEEDCSSVTKISMFAEGGNAEEGWPEIALGYGNGILNSYLQVATLEVSAVETVASDATSTPTLEESVATAGAFFPNGWPEIYASEDVLAVAGEGYRHRSWTRTWEETTYFLLFRLSSSGGSSESLAASALAVGKAPGYVLNQFAMDHYATEDADTFRVATTSRAQWACVDRELEDPDKVWYWRCDWQRVSNSTSQVTVMRMPEAGGSPVMEVAKVLDNLGVTEVITSCRFFDDKAYVVTFMQTDPVYTIDFSDPLDPVVTDELKISGFSAYLHPVPPNKILAIGREADEKTGAVTGFQITLFDVSDLTDTRVLHRYTIEQRWASSAAEQSHLAFRYLQLSKLLILPVSIYPSYYSKDEPFDGFQVYHVDETEGITPLFNVSMTDSYGIRYGCWYHATLPSRSLVFTGNATFIKGHTYQSWDLNSQTLRWEHSLDTDLPDDYDCWPYWR